jgi:hypothetical protein
MELLPPKAREIAQLMAAIVALAESRAEAQKLRNLMRHAE